MYLPPGTAALIASRKQGKLDNKQGSEKGLGHFWKVGGLSFHWDGFASSMGVHLAGLDERPSHQVSVAELSSLASEDLTSAFRKLCMDAAKRLNTMPLSVETLFYAPEMRVWEKEREQ